MSLLLICVYLAFDFVSAIATMLVFRGGSSILCKRVGGGGDPQPLVISHFILNDIDKKCKQ